ncbi:hypothetical protein F0Q53_03655 [Anaplasma marginale]|uniref:Uncharacterized protein n=1 Tax=Anaplasma marginale TaxID=770 RepID=A0A643CL27_ANAMA|nr:hypothetical protein F0Q58_00150 [Anaplasma marginale]KAA8473906.1 hypothetical protein F0Q53_03655 [Anaplasma marginale]KAB0451559.1 hypothetical protein FY210_00150 [Anaplasma marginale]KAB0451589.1 hypothetical protein FY207_03835 [Anaplasma marginale]TZF79382.1 hypothetical protein FY180_00795 [Anaplasma marginale]
MPPADKSEAISANLEAGVVAGVVAAVAVGAAAAVLDAVVATGAVAGVEAVLEAGVLATTLREDETVAGTGNSIMLQLLAPDWPFAHPTFRLHIT